MEYKVIENRYVGEGMYYIKIGGSFEAKMGQFYMLRAWDKFPLLSRPISIYQIDDEGISFLYKKVGHGTQIISQLREGDPIKLEGPYGNGFEKVEGRVALVGGGIGTAIFTWVLGTRQSCWMTIGLSVRTYTLQVETRL